MKTAEKKISGILKFLQSLEGSEKKGVRRIKIF